MITNIFKRNTGLIALRVELALTILLFLFSTALFAKIKECGEYEILGVFQEKEVSSSEFIQTVNPQTRRRFNVNLVGFIGAEYNVMKKMPVKAKVVFTTKADLIHQ